MELIFLSNNRWELYDIISVKVISRLLEMPSDYWKQFIRTPVFQVKTPPCNPNYFNGNPQTPECKPVPESLLGSVDPKKNESRYTKKTYNAMTPK